MTVLKKYTKQPWEVKDYDINFLPWLNEMSPADTVASATTVVACLTAPIDTALVVDQVLATASRVKIVVSGGTAGKRYKVTVRMVTAGADGIVRKDESELEFTITDF